MNLSGTLPIPQVEAHHRKQREEGQQCEVERNVDEVAGGQTGQRAVDAALELVVRRARTDRFTDGQRDEFAHA